MCDCFHLAFPHWHGSPGTGAGRRLKGPESNGEGDSMFEEQPEFLEGERPRPQGSSPVNEFPDTETFKDIDKQTEDEIYDPYHKSNSTKKGKRVGFGSFFEKCSTAKMSQTEDSESLESGVIVKTAKEACAEGLVVSGGGKEGIFVKEVKAESPASRNLSVKEGDQILSATVYFDNVSYEDALQILEHAQPYKVEFCLKRKPPEVPPPESSKDVRQEVSPGEEASSAAERGRAKTQRRHDARISWPKFPSFSRGRKAHFRRSHSTSEAEEQKKLEMSPATSDTESPIKSQEAVKGKTKKQKMKLSSLKMKGLRSKSAEQEVEPTSGLLEIVGKQQTSEEASDLQSTRNQENTLGETPHIIVLDEKDRKETSRVRNERTFPCVTSSESELGQHKTQLISLDKTLKTSNLTDSHVDQVQHSTKGSPEVRKRKKKERAELKVNIQGKEKEGASPERLSKSPQASTFNASPKPLKTPTTGDRTLDLTAARDILVSPNVISHTELKGRQLAIDVNTQRIDLDELTVKTDQKSEAIAEKADVDISMPKSDLLLDMSNVSPLKKSQKIESGKPKKERSILITDLERYGIRTRGPMADIGKAKLHLESPASGVPAIQTEETCVKSPVKPDLSSSEGGMLESSSDINRSKAAISLSYDRASEIAGSRKDTCITTASDMGIREPSLEIQASVVPTVTNTDAIVGEPGTGPKFKLPKVNLSDFVAHEPIVKSEMDVNVPKAEFARGQLYKAENTNINTNLPKREDIEIPGMESAAKLQAATIKLPKIEKIDPSVPTLEIQKIHIDAFREASNKTDLPAFKQPKIDLPDLDVHQLITKTDVKTINTKADFSEPQTPEVTVKTPDVGVITAQASSIEIKTIESKTEASEHITKADVNNIIGEINKKSPTYKLPMTKLPDLDFHESITMTRVDFSKTKVEIEGPIMEAEVQNTEMEGEIRNKIPKRETTEIPGIPAKESEGNIQTTDINIPKIEKLDANVDYIKDTASKTDLPVFKLPKVNLFGHDIQQQITKTDVNIDVKGPKIEMKEHVLDVDTKEKALVSESKQGTFKIPQMPVFDVPSTDIVSELKLYTPGEEKFKGSKSKTQAETNLSELKKGTDVKEFSVDGTSIDLKLTKPVQTAEEPKPSVEIPSVEVVGPVVNLDNKGKEVQIEGQGSQFKMPKFGMSFPKVKGPGLDISAVEQEVDMSLHDPKIVATLPDVKVRGPSVEGEVKLPEVKTKDVDLKLKQPRVSIPVTGFSKPDIKAPDIDVSLPKEDISLLEGSVEVKGPEMDIKVLDMEDKADIDIGGSPSKLKMPTMKLPKFGISGSKGKVEGPDISVEMKVPEKEVPSGKTGVDFGTVDVDIAGPSMKIEMPQGKYKQPKLKMPSIDLSVSTPKAPEVDVKIPKADTKISTPEFEDVINPLHAEIKRPSVEAEFQEIEAGERKKFQMPHFKMPSFGMSKSGSKAPTISEDLVVSSVDVFLSEQDTELKTPKVSLGGSSVDIEVPEVKYGTADIHTSLPKTLGQKIDVKAPKIEMDVSMTKPKTEITGPSFEGIAGSQELEAQGKGKFQMPHIKMPSFGISKPELKDPKLSGDLNLPSVDISLKKPDIDIKAPEVSVDGTSVGLKLTGPELKVSGHEPSVNITAPSLDVEGPAADLDIKGKEIEIEGQGSKFKMPKFGISFPKVKGPTVDISTSKPDVDISLPEPNFEATLPDVKVMGPSVEGEIELPGVETKEIDLKLKKPKASFPKFGFSKPDIKAPEMDVSLPKGDVSLPEGSVEVKGPEMDIKSPDLEDKAEIDIGGSPSKFKMPTMKLPKFGISGSKGKVEGPDMSAEMKVPEKEGPSGKTGVDFGTVDVDIAGPSMKIEMPQGKYKQPKLKMPSIDLSVSTPKAPEVDVKIPKADTKISTPEFEDVINPLQAEIKGPSIEATAEIQEIEAGERKKFQMPRFKMPSFGMSKSASKAPTISEDVTIPAVDVSLAKPDIDMKVPKVIAEGSSVDIEVPEVKVGTKDIHASLPKTLGQKIDVKAPKIETDVSISKPKTEITGPSFEGIAGSQELEAQGKGKFQMPHIKMPSFGISKPELKDPKLSGDLNLPSVDLSLKKPDIDIKAPEVSVDGTSVDWKLTGPELTVPGHEHSINITAPSLDVEGPAADLDIKDKDIEIEGQGSKFKMPKFGISFPKVKGPTVDIRTSKPDVDISLPEPKLEATLPDVKVKGPSVEGEIQIPGVETKEMDLKLKKPKASFPKFGFSKPDITAPEMDVSLPKGDVSLPEGSVEVKGPEMDIKSLDLEDKAEIDIGGSPSKFKMPTMKLPKFGISGSKGKVEGPDISAEMKVPEKEGPSGKTGVDFGTVDVDIAGPSVKIEMPQGKYKQPKLKMPSIDLSVSTPKAPEVDVKIPKADTKISTPEFEDVINPLQAEIKGPSIEATAEIQEIEAGERKKFQMPRFKMPSFGMSKSASKAPTISGDVTIPAVDVSLTKPDIDMKVPKVIAEGSSVDIEVPEVKVGRTDIHASLPKTLGQKIDVKAPKIEMDVSMTKPKTEITGPSFEGITGSQELEAQGKGKFQMPHIKMPSFGISKPELKDPKLSGDLNLPSVDISLKKPDIDIKAPEVSVDGTSMDLKLTGPELTVSGHEPSVNITAPSLDVEGPAADLDIKGKEIEIEGQGSKFKMPKFGISFPKVKGPTVDISTSKPDVDISLPEPNFEATLPDVKVKGPSVEGEIELPGVETKEMDLKLKKPKASFPKFGFSKPDIKAPEMDVSLPKGDVSLPEGSVEVKGPEMDIKSPDLEDKAEIDIGGSPSKFKMPTMKFPKFGISDSKGKVEGPDISAEMKVPEKEGPSGKTGVDFGTVDVDIAGPSVKIEMPQGKYKQPKLKMPSIDLSVSTPKAPEVDVKIPKADTKISTPEFEDVIKPLQAEIKGPSIEATAEIQEIEAGERKKFQMPRFKMPSFGMSKSASKAPTISGDVTIPAVDVSLTKPDIDMKVPKVIAEGSSVDIEVPEVKVGTKDIHASLPKTLGQKIDIKAPKIETDVSISKPKMEITGPSFEGIAGSQELEAQGKGKFQMPHIKMPSFGISKPELKDPKLSGDLDLPSVDISLKKPDIDIKAPEVSVDGTSVDLKLTGPALTVSGHEPSVNITAPSLDVEGPAADLDIKGKVIEIEGQGSKFKMPKFGISFPKVKGPTVDISTSKPDVDISLPEPNFEATLPDVKVKGPSVEGEIELPGVETKEMDLKLKKPKASFPKFGFSKPDIKAPEMDVSLPKGDVSLPEGSVEVKGPEMDIKSPDLEDKAEIDIGGSPSKFKMPTMKFPKFGISDSKGKVEGPDISAEMKVPEKEGPSGKTGVDFGTVDVDIAGPSVKIEMPQGKYKQPKLKMPSIDLSVSTPKAPEVDVKIPKADTKISTPEFEDVIKPLQAEIKGPSIEATAEIQEIEAGERKKFQMPRFKMPSFGMSKSASKASTISGDVTIPTVDVSLTKPDIDMTVPKVIAEGSSVDITEVKVGRTDIHTSQKTGQKIDVKAPKIEMDVSMTKPKTEITGPSFEGIAGSQELEAQGKGKFQMPHIKMPSFGISKPELKDPKLSGDLNLPAVDISLKKPEIDIKAPEVSVDGTSVDLKLTGPELTVSGHEPSINITAPSLDVEGPAADLDIKGKDIEIEGQGSKFKMPKFGISFPKVKGPTVDIRTSKPDVDISLPEPKFDATLPDVKVKGPSVEGEVEVPEVETIETDLKLKKRRVSFPKFGFSKPDIKAPELDISLPKGDISLPEGSVEVKGPEVEMKAPDIEAKGEIDTGGSPSKFKMPTMKLPKFGITGSKGKAPEISAEIATPKIEAPSGKTGLDFGNVDIVGPSVEIETPQGKYEQKKLKYSADISLPEMSSPNKTYQTTKTKVGSSAAKSPEDIDLPECDNQVSVPEDNVDFSVGETPGNESEMKGPVSPSKYKLPTFKMPKFGFSAAKVEAGAIQTDSVVPAPEVAKGGVTSKPDKRSEDNSGVSKEKTSGFSLSFSKFKSREMSAGGSKGDTPSDEQSFLGDSTEDKQRSTDTSFGLSAEDKGEHKVGVERAGKSSKFSMPTLADVLKGLDLEFNIPALDEVEESQSSLKEDITPSAGKDVDLNAKIIKKDPSLSPSRTQPSAPEPGAEVSVEAPSVTKEAEVKEKSKFRFWFPKLGFTDSSEESKDIHTSVAAAEKETPPELEEKEEEKEDDKEPEAKAQKGSWFKFPKFGMSSPSKTAKIPEKEISHPEALDTGLDGDATEDESLTLSVRSSEGFADISSTVTSEQVGPSETSPTKVTVKYSEPAAVGVSEVKAPGDIVTSTARTELILLEPHVPERIDTTSSPLSAHAATPDTGDIHVITSNIQATPGTEHATLITKFETHSVSTVPTQRITLKSPSAPWTIEGSAEMPGEGFGERVAVEKHVVKEKSGDDKGTVIITQKVTRVLHAESGELVSEDTSSAIRKLKETVHSEKMRFFEGAAMSTASVSDDTAEAAALDPSAVEK